MCVCALTSIATTDDITPQAVEEKGSPGVTVPPPQPHPAASTPQPAQHVASSSRPGGGGQEEEHRGRERAGRARIGITVRSPSPEDGGGEGNLNKILLSPRAALDKRKKRGPRCVVFSVVCVLVCVVFGVCVRVWYLVCVCVCGV